MAGCYRRRSKSPPSVFPLSQCDKCRHGSIDWSWRLLKLILRAHSESSDDHGILGERPGLYRCDHLLPRRVGEGSNGETSLYALPRFSRVAPGVMGEKTADKADMARACQNVD